MPYVRPDQRKRLDPSIPTKLSVGELNYLITRLLLAQGPNSYADYNALVGMLECCKLEFYRRAVAAYEDEKKELNGDVYA